jgi:Tfp pilus assembly protein PilX
MENRKLRSKGFTLIATLLLLLLLSGIAISMLMMVSTEGKVGTHDVQNNTTFYAAEGAIEKMTSDLASTFQNIEAPTASQITRTGLINGG